MHSSTLFVKLKQRLNHLNFGQAAVGKGYALGSAILTALALMTAFVEKVELDTNDQDIVEEK